MHHNIAMKLKEKNGVWLYLFLLDVSSMREMWK